MSGESAGPTDSARATRRGVWHHAEAPRRRRGGNDARIVLAPNRTQGCGGCRVRSEFKNRTEQKPHSAQATDDCTAAGWNGGAILLLLVLHHAARRPAIIQLEARGARPSSSSKHEAPVSLTRILKSTRVPHIIYEYAVHLSAAQHATNHQPS